MVKLTVNNKNEENQYQCCNYPDNLSTVSLAQIKDTFILIIVINSKDIHPAENNQYKI